MKLRKSFAIVFCVLFSLAANAAERDEFFWLGEMNKATAVINSDVNFQRFSTPYPEVA